jgi:hypothetical protein
VAVPAVPAQVTGGFSPSFSLAVSRQPAEQGGYHRPKRIELRQGLHGDVAAGARMNQDEQREENPKVDICPCRAAQVFTITTRVLAAARIFCWNRHESSSRAAAPIVNESTTGGSYELRVAGYELLAARTR